MSDWDEDSPQLQANIERLLIHVSEEAFRRDVPTLEAAKRWHAILMHGLKIEYEDIEKFAGHFRGEPGLEGREVKIGPAYGVRSDLVAGQLHKFEKQLQQRVKLLDKKIGPDQNLSDDEKTAVLELCAWAHCEWARIHPFGNGNGRIARTWANFLAMRYGVPPFILIRPRPGGGYGVAGAAAMRGDWKPTVPIFRRMYDGFSLPPMNPRTKWPRQ